MITKKRNRYYCEYCKKSGGSAGHIQKHESSCTNNPDRECRMCRFMENIQTPLQELINLLPSESEFVTEGEYGKTLNFSAMNKAIGAVLPTLKEKAGDCPCCIFAALRQTYECFERSVYDFAEEQKKMLAEVNSDKSEDGERYGMY